MMHDKKKLTLSVNICANIIIYHHPHQLNHIISILINSIISILINSIIIISSIIIIIIKQLYNSYNTCSTHLAWEKLSGNDTFSPTTASILDGCLIGSC
jgi:hypothetical protein